MPTDPAPDPADGPLHAPGEGLEDAFVDGPDGGPGEALAAAATLPADAALTRLVAAMRMADGAMVEVVAAAGALDGALAAREEGMTVDGALRLHTGATRSDVAVVLTAAQVLDVMPVTAGLFARGVFTWGHIRTLVAQTRRLDVTTRSELDRYLGEHAGRLAKLDTDGRLGAIDDAIAVHTRADEVADRAERSPDQNVVIVTPRLDGTGTLYSDLDPEGFATVTSRLQDEADTPLAPASPGDTGVGLPGYTVDRPSRARQLADAFVRIFARTGTQATGGVPVRFTVIVDAATVTDQLAGSIQAAVAGRAPRLVRRAIDRLSCDAALDTVIRDGVSLLAASRSTPEITAATRRAIAGRDQGCRFPGCRAPVTWCDVHHVVTRAADGDHHPANLVLLCRRHHTIVHRRGWNQRLEPDGAYTITRRRRSWTTLPRLAHRLPPPDRPTASPSIRAGPDPAHRVPNADGGRRAPPPADPRPSNGRDPARRPVTDAHPDPTLPF